MREIRVRVDRSRMVDYRNCPRLRYTAYHWGGTGLKPVTPSKALDLGDRMHRVVEGLFNNHPLDALLETHLAGLGHPDRATIELPLRCWAEVRLPRLLRDYEVVMTEQELLWELGRQALVAPTDWPVHGLTKGEPFTLIIEDMIRLDALLRSRDDASLAYFELKSTNNGSPDWVRSWEHNTQVLINTLAIEELMGTRIDEVLIEGLLKNETWAYGYQDGHKQSFTYRKGWAKVGIDVPKQWWPLLEESDWATACIPVPPIRPVPAQLTRKRRELLAQEVGVWLDLQLEPNARELAFPHHDDHCNRYFRHPCVYERMCFTKAVEADPLGSGLYARRQPHHALEGSCTGS